MVLPKVAIVGRPNVGKSSIFNWLIGRRVSIVDPTSGVTRDRIAQVVKLEDRAFELFDTGGMGVEDQDGLTRDIEHQIDLALREADVVLFAVDAQTGVAPLDQIVARRVRDAGHPTLCVANKCDSPRWRQAAEAEFGEFGFPLVFVSALNNLGKSELLEAIAARLPPVDEAAVPDVVMKLAVVGKRNAGKSTFINQLAQTDRMIVSEVPGTTRDSVDVYFERNGKAFIAVDTAGVRRKRSLADSIEFYSYTRALESIRRADVVLLFFDATVEIGRVDQQLAAAIEQQAKPCIFVVNKWDLMSDLTMEDYRERLQAAFPSLGYVPRVFITAKTGRKVVTLIDKAQQLWKQANHRVTTGDLNRALQQAFEDQPPPMKRHRRGKLYYASQVGVAPPTLVLFCNDPSLIGAPYRRYLMKLCREQFPFPEIPIRLEFRRRDTEASATRRSAEREALGVVIDHSEPEEKASNEPTPSDA